MGQPSSAAFAISSPIKILVAEDHATVRTMVTATLKKEPHFDVIGEAENGLQAVQKAESIKTRRRCFNINMPVLDGFEAARRIRKSLPEVAIVILSSQADRHFIEAGKKIGARAFVPKTEAAIALVKAIEAAIRNDEFFGVE